MNLLIVTPKEDQHARMVVAAMAAVGRHCVSIWSAPQFSFDVPVSISVDHVGSHWCCGGEIIPTDKFDAIWYRRPSQVQPPAETLHPDDFRFAQKETSRFFDALWLAAEPSTRWIHSPMISAAAESKPNQLSIAKRIGFSVPPTIIGNDRAAIQAFIGKAQTEGHSVVYKTFTPIGWEEGVNARLMFTAAASIENIRQNAHIESVPGIYQWRVAKALEVRATFFGERELTVAIDSQAIPTAKEDWRAAKQLAGHLSPISLPDAIREKCLRMMTEMSLHMACFDFIVDESGQYHFLELNQQGQFLWVEELCPEVKMLSAFVEFLTNETTNSGVSLSDVTRSDRYAEINVFLDARHQGLSTILEGQVA